MLNCPYCGGKAILRDSEIVYHGNSFGFAWICENYPRCDSYVGCHRTNNKPLGRLANAELREWKQRAHAAIDDLWKSGQYKRWQVYRLISDMMGTPFTDTHIGMMDVPECKDLIKSMYIFRTKERLF
jgi:hypothetical protein